MAGNAEKNGLFMPEESCQNHDDTTGTELPVVSSSSLVHNTSDLPSHHLHPSVQQGSFIASLLSDGLRQQPAGWWEQWSFTFLLS